MRVEFGVIDHLDRQDRPIHATFDDRLELMTLYDRAGFSTFHLTEHHFTPLGLAPSPLVFLAAASRVTERIRLAPLVLILSLYEPLRLAGEICMLDQLSKGRLDIGVGRGISPYELSYLNVNALETPAIFREAYEVLLMALTRESVDYRGTYFKYFNVPMELQPHQPRIRRCGTPPAIPPVRHGRRGRTATLPSCCRRNARGSSLTSTNPRGRRRTALRGGRRRRSA